MSIEFEKGIGTGWLVDELESRTSLMRNGNRSATQQQAFTGVSAWSARDSI